MQIRIDVTRQIADLRLIDELLAIYHQSFAQHRNGSVALQECYSDDDFRRAMDDPDYVKFVGSIDGATVGLGLVTNNLALARINYANDAFFKAQYPEAYAQKRLYYFTAIAVMPQWQGQRVFFDAMAGEMTQFIDAAGGSVVFDHSTNTNPHLPQALESVIRRTQQKRNLSTDSTKSTMLGSQAYWLIEFTKKEPKDP